MVKRCLYYSVLQYQKENIELLKKCFDVTTLPDPSCDTTEILNDKEIIFAPLGYFFGREKIDRARKLRVIASNTTGVQHINVDYALRKNIKIISLENQRRFLKGITPTAELTWGLILGVTRRIPWAFGAVCKGEWNRRLFGASKMLSAMTLGIIGLGRLGTMVAHYGRTFGMRVLYYDPYVPRPTVSGTERIKTIEQLVANSDIVTVHASLTSETRGLISGKVFCKFKRNSYLVNTARAEIVDNRALLRSLKKGILAGAAMDVFDGEFNPGFSRSFKSHPLLEYARTHDNLLITPHIGGSTVDAWSKTERFTIEAILKFFKENGK